MNHYPLKQSTFLQLVGQSFFHYGRSLQAIFPTIILSTLLQEAIFYLRDVHFNQIVQIIIYILFILLEVYIWSVAIYRVHLVIKGEPISFRAASSWILNKLSLIYMGIFAFILAITALFFVGYILVHIISLFFRNGVYLQEILLIFLIGLPLTFGLILFYFVLPLLILEPIDVWPAFRESAKLVGIGVNWLRTFVAYAVNLLLVMVLLPETRHIVWLQQYHIVFLFDLVLLSIVAPVLINFVLLLLNDLKQYSISSINNATTPNK